MKKIGIQFIQRFTEDCFILFGIHWVKIPKGEAIKLVNLPSITADSDINPDDATKFNRANVFLFYKKEDQQVFDIPEYQTYEKNIKSKEKTQKTMLKTKHKRAIQYNISSEYDLIKEKVKEIEKDGRTIAQKYLTKK